MVERNQNRTGLVVSNAAIAVNRVIEDTIDQLENMMTATRRDSRAEGVMKSPFLKTAERPTSKAPTARSTSISSEAGSLVSNRYVNLRRLKFMYSRKSYRISFCHCYTKVDLMKTRRPRTTTARENSSFDDTSAGSGRVSTAVSPMNDPNKKPKILINAGLNERRGRSPTVKTNANSQQALTPRTAWANVSVGGRTVIKPRSNHTAASLNLSGANVTVIVLHLGPNHDHHNTTEPLRAALTLSCSLL
ncbi:hypothetical protein DICVIV_01438 [Dictyocaulus viviparus]|uniref:Uncharacterized protein n=1 Tax=Dictyocaulus viviparus TaxID=29172 RepID=A0A0D8YCP2_DICVI|nr:hypothetical protein DICVIV_01438 [Dictyocaulus viviparus]